MFYVPRRMVRPGGVERAPMTPFYKSSTFWLSLLAAVAGYVQSLQGVPGSVTQIAGLIVTGLTVLGYTAHRTVLAHQDSAEAHEKDLASLKVTIPEVK